MAVINPGQIAISANGQNFLRPDKPKVSVEKIGHKTYRMDITLLFTPDIENKTEEAVEVPDDDYFITDVGTISESVSNVVNSRFVGVGGSVQLQTDTLNIAPSPL